MHLWTRQATPATPLADTASDIAAFLRLMCEKHELRPVRIGYYQLDQDRHGVRIKSSQDNAHLYAELVPLDHCMDRQNQNWGGISGPTWLKHHCESINHAIHSEYQKFGLTDLPYPILLSKSVQPEHAGETGILLPLATLVQHPSKLKAMVKTLQRRGWFKEAGHAGSALIGAALAGKSVNDVVQDSEKPPSFTIPMLEAAGGFGLLLWQFSRIEDKYITKTTMRESYQEKDDALPPAQPDSSLVGTRAMWQEIAANMTKFIGEQASRAPLR